MASRFPSEKYLQQRAHALCLGLSYRLEELVNDFPAGTPKVVIEFLQEVLKSLLALVNRTDNPGTLSWICVLIEQDLSGVLTWLDNAHTAQTPRALVRVLQRMAKKLAPGSELMVAPDYECNYSTFDLIRWFRGLLVNLLSKQEIRRLFAMLPSEIQLVQFPRIERDHVLNHVIFGHEFGHPIAEAFIDDHESSSMAYRRQVRRVIEELKDLQRRRGLRGRERDEQQKQDFKEVEEIWRRGLEELISDAVSTYVFGPSALFAAIDNFSASRLDDLPDAEEYYPPPRYRYRVMHELLEEEGHLDALEKLGASTEIDGDAEAVSIVLEYLEALTDNDSDQRAIQAHVLCDIAYRWLASTLPEALRYARSECARVRLVYAPATSLKEVPQLRARLAYNVPPGEIGTWPESEVVDWRSSVLAGWLTMLCHSLDVANSAEQAAAKAQAVNKLTLKGIEYAVLSEEYSAARTRGFR
jgi:hypothetical protein